MKFSILNLACSQVDIRSVFVFAPGPFLSICGPRWCGPLSHGPISCGPLCPISCGNVWPTWPKLARCGLFATMAQAARNLPSFLLSPQPDAARAPGHCPKLRTLSQNLSSGNQRKLEKRVDARIWQGRENWNFESKSYLVFLEQKFFKKIKRNDPANGFHELLLLKFQQIF